MAIREVTKYAARSYESIKAWFFEYAKIYLPEMTDFNSSNPFIALIEFNAGTNEMVHRYTNFYSNETYITTVRKFQSAYYIANNFNYRIKGTYPATVLLTFSVPTATPSLITIPKGTIVETPAGLRYETVDIGNIAIGQTSTQIWAKQQIAVESIVFFANGQANYTIPLESKIVDKEITAKIAGETWLFQETLAYSSATDLHFTAGLNQDQVMQITFGDGTNGKIPENGVPIQIYYYVSEGLLGNVSELAINKIVSTGLPTNLAVSNLDAASGGANQETLTDLRKTVPLFNRTKERAVTEQDFVDVVQLHPAVAKASVLFECGSPVELFIAPKSGGVSSDLLLQEVADFMDLRKVAVELIVRSIGIFRLEWSIEVKAKPDAVRTDLELAIKNNIVNFFSVTNQEASGSLYFSQFYATLQNTTGVDTAVVNPPIMRPYARPVGTSPVLNWTATVQTTSTAKRYYRITFTTATAYQLRISTDKTTYTLLGTYNTNTAYSDTFVAFTITGSYTIGNIYEFVSYEYLQRFNQILELDEPSMLLSQESDIDLTITGGL